MKNDILDQFIVSMNIVESKAKGYFFTKDAMRFFNSRLPKDAFLSSLGVYYFITSECGPNGVRAFTIRQMDLEGAISTIGEFKEYATKAQAKSALRQILTSSIAR